MKRRELFEKFSNEAGLDINAAANYLAQTLHCETSAQIEWCKYHVSTIIFFEFYF